MAQKETLLTADGQLAPGLSAQGDTAAGARDRDILQDVGLSLVPLDSEGVVQPFPRSPKLLRRLAKAGGLSSEQLSACVQELQAERSRAEAHIKSLKKRKADFSRRTEVMKQQVQERFEAMRATLEVNQRATTDSLGLNLRLTRDRLDQVLRSWEQHLNEVNGAATAAQRALNRRKEGNGDAEEPPEIPRSKKPDASEAEIRLNEERFERLLKILFSISKDLKAQLQRKTLLLDSTQVSIDSHTCHSQIAVTAEGQMCFSSSPQLAVNHPLQFDKVCCALGSEAIAAGQRYWEVDVRCCSAWAVGVAYGCLERKGRDKGPKLGRNRNSWCVELRDGRLSAWHNDHSVACRGTGRALPGKVGVQVNFDKGQLTFYDAENMEVMQKFSAVMTPLFDRAHHQFTEPLYPAMRFLRPPGSQIWPNHMEICCPDTL